MKVSVIILDYRKSRRVLENIASLRAQKLDCELEIIVVDNSCDAAGRAKLETLREQTDIKLIFNEHNLGYTRGVNRGAQVATGEYLLILNPDIVWRDETALQTLVDYLDQHSECGIVGPRQINETNSQISPNPSLKRGEPTLSEKEEGKQGDFINENTALTVRAFPRLRVQIARRTWLQHLPYFQRLIADYEMRAMDWSQTQPVDWLQSSCLLVRRALWERLGGLDERYFLFMSDPELCWRAWAAAQQTVYLPTAVVYADGLRASRGGFLSIFTSRALRLHIVDAFRYWWRHKGRISPRK